MPKAKRRVRQKANLAFMPKANRVFMPTTKRDNKAVGRNASRHPL